MTCVVSVVGGSRPRSFKIAVFGGCHFCRLIGCLGLVLFAVLSVVVVSM